MTNQVQHPWAILLCRFSDDLNDPNRTTLSTLYAQWLANFGANWVANNLTPDWSTDLRTILDLYRSFFTATGAGTFNAPRFWDAMSHGSIDISGSTVFACTLDMTAAEGAALAQHPGGRQYQEAIFKKAKTALQSQYGADWKKFYGVAVSFQSPDYGAQGGSYDGGPGVYMDIRFVRVNGMAAWGQEMGHAFGLDHSRRQGSTDDYLDPWDAMSTMNAYCLTPDAAYGERGIGLNAWNMRGRQWLDERRIWKAQAQTDFASEVTLRPLHRRELSGFLGAELPGIAGDSSYLVELRVAEDWDQNIPVPTVLVHRFEGSIGQFFGTHSYLMMGTRGQVFLSEGDFFKVGSGPVSSVHVRSIDPTNETAVVSLCYSTVAPAEPTVSIQPISAGACPEPPVEGSYVKFRLELSNPPCGQGYTVLWGVIGARSPIGEANDGPTYAVVSPDPSQLVTVTATLFFDDGTSISAPQYSFHSMALAQADWISFLCQLRNEARTQPIPWWEWDPEKLRQTAQEYSAPELRLMADRAERLVQTLVQLSEIQQEVGREGR